MRILHTEASTGMGGQEIRILREALGMRKRGHEIFFAVHKGAELGKRARGEGFFVYELSFKKFHFPLTFVRLLSWIRRHKIQIVNTHSSLDAWIGGMAAKCAGAFIIRTRHLSTPVKKGVNSKLLYNFLAHFTVTTCKVTREMIEAQAGLPAGRAASIPTGIDSASLVYDPQKVARFREDLGLKKDDFLVGTVCVLRGWKGIYDLLHAAKHLEYIPSLKWLVVGEGVSGEYFKTIQRQLRLEEKVIFAGYLDPPYTALAAMDLFLLLSWGNEGVSQAALQAAWLKKPLVTTRVGGLGEVCLDQVTGLHVDTHSSSQVAEAVLKLRANPAVRQEMGERGHQLVAQNFTFENMLDEMESLYRSVPRSGQFR